MGIALAFHPIVARALWSLSADGIFACLSCIPWVIARRVPGKTGRVSILPVIPTTAPCAIHLPRKMLPIPCCPRICSRAFPGFRIVPICSQTFLGFRIVPICSQTFLGFRIIPICSQTFPGFRIVPICSQTFPGFRIVPIYRRTSCPSSRSRP